MRPSLRIFNTLTRRSERFESMMPGIARMFVCGPTVQDYAHVGHARTYLFYDMLARYLKYRGYDVSFVINITDIDEGIVKGAAAAGVSAERFASKYETAFIEDMSSIGIGSVSSYDKVSLHVPQMVAQAEGLISKGHAYRLGGSVYFSVDSYPRFGQLSGQSRRDISLRPLEIAEGKKNQADFSLWRVGSKDEQKWEGPWGKGVPGWHIQDTAVSYAHFGPQYDIHGGARELIYPHHEAEIAQMECLTGKRPFVKYWVHSGLLTQGNEKMAKSRGNVMTVRAAVKDYGVAALRLYMLSLQHRRDAEFDEAELGRWRDRFEALRDKVLASSKQRSGKPGPSATRFFASLDDDIRSDRAIAILESSVMRETEDSGLLVDCAEKILGIHLAG